MFKMLPVFCDFTFNVFLFWFNLRPRPSVSVWSRSKSADKSLINYYFRDKLLLLQHFPYQPCRSVRDDIYVELIASRDY